MVDMNAYAGPVFYTLEDLADGTREETIAEVVDGNYDKPDLVFESGMRLSLNKTNARKLRIKLGSDHTTYTGHRVKLYVGETEFQSKKQKSVLLEVLPAPDATESEQAAPKSPPPDDMGGDAIPF